MTTCADHHYEVLLSARPTAAATYQRLGALSPVERWDLLDAAAACGVPAERVREELEHLVAAALLAKGPESGFYRLLDPVHAARVAVDLSEEVMETARRGYMGWLLAAATLAEYLLTPEHHRQVHGGRLSAGQAVAAPIADKPAARAWLTSHRSQLFVSIRTAALRGRHSEVSQLTLASWPEFEMSGPGEEWIELHETALSSAGACGDRKAELILHNTLAIGYRETGRLDEAIGAFSAVRDLARELSDRHMLAQALNGLGGTHMRADRYEESVSALTQARDIRADIGYRRGVALSDLSLGRTELELGDAAAAVALLERARVTLRAHGDELNAARALTYLAQARIATGDAIGGDRDLALAVVEFRHIGDLRRAAQASERAGRNRADNYLHGANDLTRQATQLYREAGLVEEADRLKRELPLTAPLTADGSASGDEGSTE